MVPVHRAWATLVASPGSARLVRGSRLVTHYLIVIGIAEAAAVVRLPPEGLQHFRRFSLARQSAKAAG